MFHLCIFVYVYSTLVLFCKLRNIVSKIRYVRISNSENNAAIKVKYLPRLFLFVGTIKRPRISVRCNIYFVFYKYHSFRLIFYLSCKNSFDYLFLRGLVRCNVDYRKCSMYCPSVCTVQRLPSRCQAVARQKVWEVRRK